MERCCVHNISPFILSSRLSPGSREAEVQRARVCLNCTEPSVARSSYWSLPVGQYLSDSCCKGSIVILANIELRAIWLKSCRCLLVARWENGKQPVPLTSAFDTWRVPCMTPPQWPTTSTSTLANIAHASMVWHGASGHHFSMAWLLASVLNCDLVPDPTVHLPVFSLPRKQWCTLNCYRTNKDNVALAASSGAWMKVTYMCVWYHSVLYLSFRLLDLTLLLMFFPFLPPPSGTISLRMFDHALNRPLSNRD